MRAVLFPGIFGIGKIVMKFPFAEHIGVPFFQGKQFFPLPDIAFSVQHIFKDMAFPTAAFNFIGRIGPGDAGQKRGKAGASLSRVEGEFFFWGVPFGKRVKIRCFCHDGLSFGIKIALIDTYSGIFSMFFSEKQRYNVPNINLS